MLRDWAEGQKAAAQSSPSDQPHFKALERNGETDFVFLISCTPSFWLGYENWISHLLCFWSRFHPHQSVHLHQSPYQVHRHEQQTLLVHQKGWNRCDLRSESHRQLTEGYSRALWKAFWRTECKVFRWNADRSWTSWWSSAAEAGCQELNSSSESKHLTETFTSGAKTSSSVLVGDGHTQGIMLNRDNWAVFRKRTTRELIWAAFDNSAHILLGVSHWVGEMNL